MAGKKTDNVTEKEVGKVTEKQAKVTGKKAEEKSRGRDREGHGEGHRVRNRRFATGVVRAR